jgi:erythronate-4-phosphate dehydrogenase
VVDTQALLEALKTKHLAAAVIDVWENEPLINHDLLRKVFIATPHIAGYSADGKANATLMAVQAINEFFNLNIPNLNLHIPEPSNNRLILNNSSSFEDLTGQAILHTYPIHRDHALLYNNPDNFEKFRENYPLRREFHAYTIHLTNYDSSLSNCLTTLGFNIE